MNHTQRIELARTCLLGVSIGDAFGDSFFGDEQHMADSIHARQIPDTRWEFTDDTVMSIAVFEELERDGTIDQSSLIQKFCRNHDLDPNRGYGATVRRLLREIQEGKDWREISKNVFEGQGSMGNGAAMRACPIGAYHFDNLDFVKELATKSAEVTHSNTEAIAGAIAVATATALTTSISQTQKVISTEEFVQRILSSLPECDTKSKIATTLTVPMNYRIETVRKILGNGNNMTAQDTVPMVIWCCMHKLSHFENALWKAVSALGDRDTICAMVGGITIMSSPQEHIPQRWKDSVEKFEKSIFR